MQEDFEIIVIVSLLVRLDFFVKLLPECKKTYEIIVIVSLFMR